MVKETYEGNEIDETFVHSKNNFPILLFRMNRFLHFNPKRKTCNA